MEESKNGKRGETGNLEHFLLLEKSNFRKKCFAKQLSLLKPLVIHTVIPGVIDIFMIRFFGLFPLSSCLLFGGCLLMWSVAPEEAERLITAVRKGLLGIQGKEAKVTEANMDFRERISFIAMAIHIILFQAANALAMKTNTSLVLRAETVGFHGALLKMGLTCLHYSDVHFHFLHLMDTCLTIFLTFTIFAAEAGPIDGPEICKVVVVQLSFITILVIKYREGVKVTIAEAFKELILREKAEKGRKSFMSYIMHEMRNPLSGASLLVSEFQSMLNEVLSVADDCASASARVTRRKLLRLLRLAVLLSGQTDKMRGVCDDVLQMEKLDRGGFEFVFSSQDVRAWFEDVTAQTAPLFGEPVLGLPSAGGKECEKKTIRGEEGRGSSEKVRRTSSECSSGDEEAKGPSASGSGPPTAVRFSWAFEVSPEIEREMETHSVGVADFRRLEQVMGNFVSNARKFTKRGEVRVEGKLRSPSEDEQEHFLSLVSLPSSAAASESPSSKKDVLGSPPPSKSQRGGGVKPFFPVGGEEKVTTTATKQWREAICELRDLQKEENEMDSGGEELVKEETKEGRLPCAVLRVSVRDTGPGLSEEEMQKLFKPYSQIRSGELQNGGGTGLGLCICKSFVEAHGGGQIGVESEGPGRGSTFFFQLFLPLVKGASNDGGPPAELDSPLPPGNVKPLNAPSTMADLFVSAATPRRQGITRVAKKRMSMCRCSSQSESEEVEGPSGQQKQQEVRDDIHRQQDTSALPDSPSCPSACVSSPVYEADVLIVDDDQFCLLAGKAAIKRLGYSVKTASDGDEAVDLLVRRRLNFRLVLMDNNMARMNGPEAVRQIRNHFARTLQQREKQKMGASGGKGGHENERNQRDAQNESQDEKSDDKKTRASPASPMPAQAVPLLLGCTGDVHCDEMFLKAGAARVIHKPLRAAELSETLQSLRRQNLSLSGSV
uniref:histidine kinase n=1 Tax=Chromera velia CCMP2878 TaxID=1169474 RepID=A0A0G4FPT4_9ALVE|eukprot:Cvel_18021.t1-p1 / transcript=Cvel_18021.t1 / gene=Cvel_18021 / organism=Chromera_velia_CCMP2878 / gene_product=hypothetical protein / transcript_product=hypothetical protein / location=Cvel_scaffold1470:38100-42303(-) / protein_length=945 / sequence_SO=supercontig / SO=protein_coding / is_pseudo=false